MQNIVWKLLLIVVVLGVCLASIAVKDLRLGKDLQGGVSLIYHVSLDPNEPNPQQVLSRTISILKDRVNPKGVYDISMQPLGRDRIEVVMPLPNELVRNLERTFQDALTGLLRRSEIQPNALDEALKQGTAPEDMAGDLQTDRGQKIAALQDAYNGRAAARQALADAEAQGLEGADLLPYQEPVADAEIAFEDLYAEVVALSLDEPRVKRTLGLSTEPVKLLDAEDNPVLDDHGDPMEGPSPRQTALTALAEEFPNLAAQIQATVDAYDAYQSRRTGFDDPEDLMRLLRGAGVLEFHIAIRASEPGAVDVDDLRRQIEEVGPENTVSPVAKWFPINQLKQWYDDPDQLAALEADPVAYFSGFRDLVAAVYEGEHHLLLRSDAEKSMTHTGDKDWSITQTYSSPDQLGRPAVAFGLDAAGASMMGRLTATNLQEPMAIVLDGEVYSAPRIQSQITKSGQITGNFAQEEINYLIKVLAAGSLQAQLSAEPISVSILGPSLGQDNLNRGREAFIISVIAVAAFMLFYYFFAGFVADLALVANGIIIFGGMMLIDGTFTLPGLAGIVLTIGMAVDANVLIYERIREEIFSGEHDLRGAIRKGYNKALSTILDANITNLIICFVLFRTATTEVKGFALTLTIGICATLFTALFATRQIFYLYTDLIKIRRLPMLATVFPAIHHFLEPNINWVGLRRVFWVVSGLAFIASIVLVESRGVDMFDTEFRGGVSLTMGSAILDENNDGQPDVDENGEPIRLMLRHTGDPTAVEDRIRAIGERSDPATAAGEDERSRLTILREFKNAAILTEGRTTTDGAGNILGSHFQVKVSSPKGLEEDSALTRVVVEAIVEEFGNQLDAKPPLSFTGAEDNDSTSYIHPISKPELGQNIPRPEETRRVPAFVGGAAVMLQNVDPPVTEEDVAERIEKMRKQPDFAQYGARKVQVIGLTPADPEDRSAGYVGLVVLVNDPYRSFLKVESELWWREVADPEWLLIKRALQQPPSLERVSSFSSAVAETLSAQAIVAVVLSLLGILVYIWVRFGSLRYSVAAIVALVHDVTIALGLLALSAVVGTTAFGAALLIEPFRIDLGVVAALLTIIGYSLNDTIVILDRIRENRGKLPLPTAPIVNRSINQTVSRTLLTSVTTLLAVLIMYAEGGSGIRPFTFCLLVGLVVGTYSSVAIAAPLVLRGGGGEAAKAPAAVAEPPAAG